jgi:hypothetical protein
MSGDLYAAGKLAGLKRAMRTIGVTMALNFVLDNRLRRRT